MGAEAMAGTNFTFHFISGLRRTLRRSNP